VFANALLEHFSELPNYFITSAETRIGKDQVLSFMEGAMATWKESAAQSGD
jgi:hypothetical protein